MYNKKGIRLNALSPFFLFFFECPKYITAVDVPVIPSEEYADRLARILCNAVIEKSGATKKVVRKSLCVVWLGPYETLEDAELLKGAVLGENIIGI